TTRPATWWNCSSRPPDTTSGPRSRAPDRLPGPFPDTREDYRMSTVTVRYFVTGLDAAVAFYRDLLGFEEELRPSPAFAMLYRGDRRWLLSVPGGGQGGGAAMPDGTLPEPGGWNRIALQVEALPAAVEGLRGKGAHFRNDVVTGVGVRQILIEDPSGNAVELFEPLGAYHERAAG